MDEPMTKTGILELMQNEREAFERLLEKQKHQRAPYTLRFVEALYPNCEVEPSFTDLIMIQSSGSGT
jgi:hypothetical protein